MQDDSYKKRMQSEILIPGVSTLIGKKTLYSNEKNRRLQISQRRYAKCKDVNKKKKVHIEVSRIIAQLELPKMVLDETNFMFDKIEDRIPKCSKVLSINNVVPVLIFLASKRHDYGIQLKKIVEYAKIPNETKFRQALYKCNMLLKEEGQMVLMSKVRIMNRVVEILNNSENNRTTINVKDLLEFLIPLLQGIREKTQIALVSFIAMKITGRNTKPVIQECEIHPRKLRKSLNRILSKSTLNGIRVNSIDDFCREIKNELAKLEKNRTDSSSKRNDLLLSRVPKEKNSENTPSDILQGRQVQFS